MVNIYLSGSMEDRNFNEVLLERAHAESRLMAEGFTVFDPFDCIETIDGDIAVERYEGLEMSEIVARDELAIKNSDAIIVLTGDNPTTGTWFEFAFAHYCVKIPIVVIAPNIKEGKKQNWTTYKATKVVSDIDTAAKWLSKFFKYELLALQK